MALVATVVVSAIGSQARADETDPWWGRDKALHFAASGVIAAGGYTVGAAVFDARYEALLVGAGAAVAAGAGKELADLAGAGHASWKDFTWDLVGTAAGLALAWTLDLALRGSELPPLGHRRQAQPSAVLVRF
jgi:putative lipoprotein